MSKNPPRPAPVLPDAYRSLVELAQRRAGEQPDRLGYHFLSEGEEVDRLSYGALDRRARAIAAHLQSRGCAPGDRVLLILTPGLRFVEAFFGCLYAGVMAVPAYPPRRMHDETLQRIARDAEPVAGLTDLPEGLHVALPSQISWRRVQEISDDAADAWSPVAPDRQDLAFLQYTSGSTSTPRGVVLSHGNLLANTEVIHELFGCEPGGQAVSWLPPYHDMGLIGGILTPLRGGFPIALMSPLDFLRRPRRWLQAITRYGGVYSGGPNFAYEHCVAKIPPSEREGLDLSSWKIAFNGAEPIRPDTLRRFREAFAPHGFEPGAAYPCYGLAESSLLVTGALRGGGPVVAQVDREALERDKRATPAAGGVALVSSGCAAPGAEVVVVDPGTRTPLAPERVGEIWIRGPSVARGYWRNPEATRAAFAARLRGGEGPFLRTGDLGFLRGGELFVVGRVKDLIILNGRNIAPHDVEIAAEASAPALRSNASAAFSVEVGGRERLAIACEIAARSGAGLDAGAIAAAIRGAISRALAVEVYAVLVVERGGVPRTTSGKIRRGACRTAWREGALPLVGESVREPPAEAPIERSESSALRARAEALLREEMGTILGLSPERVPLDQPLDALGLGSINAVAVQAELEDRLGLRVPVEAFFEATTGYALIDLALASRSTASASTAPQAPSEQPTPAATAAPGADAEAEAICEWLRGYAESRLDLQLADARRSLPPHVVLDLGNRGVLGLQAPARYGGLGLGHAQTARVIEQLAAIDLSLALLVGAHTALGTRPVQRFAPDALRESLLPRLAQGRILGAFALSEPGAGANPRALSTIARPEGAGWRLRGEKAWIGSGSWAGVVHVFARQVDAAGRTIGLTGFAVPQGARGLRVGPEALTMGMRGTAQCRLSLQGVSVGPDRVLGAPGAGMAVARDAMSAGRLGVGAMALGAMKRCFQLMERYASARAIATGRLIDAPTARSWLGELADQIVALEALVQMTAGALDRPEAPPELEPMTLACKIAGAELAGVAADRAVQLLGARGYTEPNLAARIYRDVRALRIFEGPTETLSAHLGRRLTRGDAALSGWLRRLGDDEAAGALERAGQSAAQAGEGELGEAAVWAVLGAAARSQARDLSAASWFVEARERALERAGRQGAACADPGGLAAQFTSSIGAIPRGIQGEDRAMDPALAPREAPPVPQAEIAAFPEVVRLRRSLDSMAETNPYFRVRGGVSGDRVQIDGRELLNFSSYDYLGLSGHPEVAAAAREAIDAHGTSVSASRLTSGEIQIHQDLEAAIAEQVGAEDALVLVGGFATNVTVVGHLVGPRDLVVSDALIHSSVTRGAELSGAARMSFPHNDWRALDRLLERERGKHRRVLIAIEGAYSMDGDIPDLPAFIDVKRRRGALLMVDEAHSMGVLGPTGRGIGERFGVSPADVDVWMGTLSKSFASCGGYLAGSRALITWLRYTAPGFVYSAGISPANAAAALAAIRLLRREPQRVARLQENARSFAAAARAAGLRVGPCGESAVVPVIVGDSARCLAAARALEERGVRVMPIFFPAVPEGQARLRFFLSSEHTREQIQRAVQTVARTLGASEVSDARHA